MSSSRSNGGAGPSKMLTPPMCIGLAGPSMCRNDASMRAHPLHGRSSRSTDPSARRRARRGPPPVPDTPRGSPTCRSGSTRPRRTPRTGPDTPSMRRFRRFASRSATARNVPGSGASQVGAEASAAVAVLAPRSRTARARRDHRAARPTALRSSPPGRRSAGRARASRASRAVLDERPGCAGPPPGRARHRGSVR